MIPRRLRDRVAAARGAGVVVGRPFRVRERGEGGRGHGHGEDGIREQVEGLDDRVDVDDADVDGAGRVGQPERERDGGLLGRQSEHPGPGERRGPLSEALREGQGRAQPGPGPQGRHEQRQAQDEHARRRATGEDPDGRVLHGVRGDGARDEAAVGHVGDDDDQAREQRRERRREEASVRLEHARRAPRRCRRARPGARRSAASSCRGRRCPGGRGRRAGGRSATAPRGRPRPRAGRGRRRPR